MKKYRLVSFFLCIPLLAGLLVLPAAAAGSADPTATAEASGIVAGMHIEARAALLADPDTDEVLYAQNAHERMYPASITKVMTALLALEAVDRGDLSMDQVITVSNDVFTGIGEGGSTVDIKPGEQLTVRDLLNCALIPSANEACNALAVAVSGSIAAFVEQMNQRAAEIGMAETHFANTHGYHDDNHDTTAYDVYLMCREAMDHAEFRTIVSSKNYTVPATNLHEQRVVRDTNALISNYRITGYLYEYANGIKTGSTPEAGYCLAASASKNGKNLISVVLGAENPKDAAGNTSRLQFSESARLLEWGFNNFSQQTILDDTALNIAEIPVTLSDQVNSLVVRPEGTLTATLPNDMDVKDFDWDWSLIAESVEAPVEEGQVLGSITVSYKGTEYGTLDLVANTSVSRSEWLYRLDRIQKFFGQLWVRIVIAAVLVLIAVLVLRRVLFRGQRGGGRRRGYAYSGSRYTGGRRRKR